MWWGARAEQVLGVPANEVVGRRCFDVLGDSRVAGQTICGPGCWVARALSRGQTVPAFCMDLCVAGRQRRAFTLGFLVDESTKFLIHVFRECLPGESAQDGQAAGTAQPGPSADQAEIAGLTRRQHQVLQLIVSGATSIQIARSLGVTHATARNHVQNLLTRLGVRSRLEAALLAQRTGAVTVPERTS